MRRSFYVAGALALSAGVLPGQASTRSRSRSDDAPVRGYAYSTDRFDDRDRAAIGITTSSGGLRDTLGLLVSSVTAGGPADKAGIEEGNRLVSVNGVNLRLSAADAGEGDMGDIANRRLIRELEKVKAGDDVELRVWAGGQTKSVKVKTVALEDLPSRTRNVRREIEDRPVLGLSLSATGSRRDTLGMLVVRVATDGPAEKAGLVEGDRIAAINGVSLKVAAEDAGDGYMSSARMNRYRRELAKVSVGEDVELRVLSGGQSKTIRIKPVRASDLPRQRGGVMIIGDGAVSIGDIFPALPSITIPPAAPTSPRAPRVFEFDGNLNDGIRMRIDPRVRMEIEEQTQDAVRRARDAARDALERIERFRFDYDRRADDFDSAAPIAVPTPTPAPPAAPRARASGRIASAGSGPTFGYSYSTSGEGAYGNVAYATDATPAAAAVATTYPEPASVAGRVWTWNGDDAAFTLEGLRLARVNDDLAENLGRGSERGFLVLDVGQHWSGLRAGDVLIEVDGHVVRNGRTARIALGEGDTHTASVIRDGHTRVVSVDVQ